MYNLGTEMQLGSNHKILFAASIQKSQHTTYLLPKKHLTHERWVTAMKCQSHETICSIRTRRYYKKLQYEQYKSSILVQYLNCYDPIMSNEFYKTVIQVWFNVSASGQLVIFCHLNFYWTILFLLSTYLKKLFIFHSFDGQSYSYNLEYDSQRVSATDSVWR